MVDGEAGGVAPAEPARDPDPGGSAASEGRARSTPGEEVSSHSGGADVAPGPIREAIFRVAAMSVVAAAPLAALETIRWARSFDGRIALLDGSPPVRLAAAYVVLLGVAVVPIGAVALAGGRKGAGGRALGAAVGLAALVVLATLAAPGAALAPVSAARQAARAAALLVPALAVGWVAARFVADSASSILLGNGRLAFVALLPAGVFAWALPGAGLAVRGGIGVAGLVLLGLLVLGSRRFPRLEAAALLVACGGIFVAGLAIGALPAGRAERSAVPGRAILLVTIDSLRADAVFPADGSPGRMPTLARLAREGVRFDRAVSSAPCTNPAVASILTGRLPSSLGFTDPLDWSQPLGEAVPQRLERRGWRTGAIVANGFATPGSGFRPGFGTIRPPWLRGALLEPLLGSPGLAAVGWALAGRPLRDPLRREGAPPVANRAIEWLGAVEGDTSPWFLWLHFNDPHTPYFDEKGKAAGLSFGGDPGNLIPERLGDQRADSAAARRLKEAWTVELGRVDRALERILGALAASGRLESTLVIVTADHGEEFLDHGGFFHGHSLHEELLHVPLVMRWPTGVPGGARGIHVESRVRTMDLAPTLAEFAGIDLPGVEGESLLPLLVGGEPAADRDLVAEANAFRTPMAAFYRGSSKLVLTRDGDLVSFRDLAVDPGEVGGAIPPAPERLEEARAWLRRRPSVLRGPGGGAGSPGPANFHDLGYLR